MSPIKIFARAITFILVTAPVKADWPTRPITVEKHSGVFWF